jgi:hypothetical protein
LVDEKRNRLRDLAAEDLGLEVKQSPTRRSDDGSSPMAEDTHFHMSVATNRNILDTPLANAMKKVGMTPSLNSHLSEHLKKKVVP